MDAPTRWRGIPIRRRFFLLAAVTAGMVLVLLALFWRYEAIQDELRGEQVRAQQLDLALRTIQSDSNRLQALIWQYIARPDAGAQLAATQLGKSLLERVTGHAAASTALRAPLSSAQGAVGVLVSSFDRLVTLNTQISSGIETGVLGSEREASALFDKSATPPARTAFGELSLALAAFYLRPGTAAIDGARDKVERVLAALGAGAAAKPLAERVLGIESTLLRLESLILERDGVMRVDVGVSAERLTALANTLIADNQKQQAALEARFRAEQRNTLITLAVLGLLVTGLGAYLSWTITRSVTQPLATLTASADAFAAGDLAHEVPGGDAPDELGTLARTLQTLKTGAQARHAAEAAMRVSEERYRNLVDNVPETMLVAQGAHIIFANPRACELTGYAMPALLSMPFVDLLHPDDVELVAERHRRRMAGEPVERYTHFRIRRADGGFIWVESSATAVDWDGRQATLAFVSDLTGRRRAEESVRTALERQKELNDLRTRFIAMASHEFRTPLATILSSTEILRDYGERLPADERREVMRAIENGVQRMASLLDDVLTVGAVDSGKLEFNPVLVALRPFLSSLAAEIMRSESRQGRGDRHVQIEAREDAAAPVDEQLLRHALGNFISNAVKYSPAGGVVCCGASLAYGAATFTITDHGIGIPEADLPHLFEAFHRGTNTKGVPGTGLGLAIAKKAVEIHRGTVHVDSAPGKGTRVTVTIPV
jgi:PAS domain S-box-containing protein